MKPGPRTGAANNSDRRSYAEKAKAAWGDVPDWVAELAAYADQHGAKPTGAAIGYSNSAVSVVISQGSGFEKFDLDRIEQAVRGGLMGLTVECPILGDIGRDRCLQEQQEPFRSTSSFRAQIYHACRSGCDHARQKGTKNVTE